MTGAVAVIDELIGHARGRNQEQPRLHEARAAVAELIAAAKEHADAEDRNAHAYIILKAGVRVRAALAGVGA